MSKQQNRRRVCKLCKTIKTPGGKLCLECRINKRIARQVAQTLNPKMESTWWGHDLVMKSLVTRTTHFYDFIMSHVSEIPTSGASKEMKWVIPHGRLSGKKHAQQIIQASNKLKELLKSSTKQGKPSTPRKSK